MHVSEGRGVLQGVMGSAVRKGELRRVRPSVVRNRQMVISFVSLSLLCVDS